MSGRNLRTRLRTRAAADPMRAYDRLPAPLRAWLARASLPWSPASARRIWDRALAAARGDTAAALAALARAERRTLARDVPRIWGPGHPGADAPGPGAKSLEKAFANPLGKGFAPGRAGQPSSAAGMIGQNRPPERTPNQSVPPTASVSPRSTIR